jgi:DNA-binding response OmpR family regulator
MRIILKVMGHSLYGKLAKEIASLNSAFPRRYKQGKAIDWQLVLLENPLRAEDLANHSTALVVVLIEAPDLNIIERLRAMERQEFLYLNTLPEYPHGVAPVILLFERDGLIPELIELPDIISDWVFDPLSMPDLARRMFASLRRKQLLQAELRFGALTLLPEARKLCYYSDSTHLTPSELAVAELFLHHFGSVILLEDIILMFKLSGRSTEGSNIRVTMFQLRFKIEALTRCHFTLLSIYKEGYSLRHTRNYDPGFPYPDLELRQELAIYDA